MSYDLMLLADPGPARDQLLGVLRGERNIRPDERVESRFWMQTPHGEVQLNIGSKDPVESVHCLVPERDLALIEAATQAVLELGIRLDMRLEDVQWGYEVTPGDLPRLRDYWRQMREPVRAPAEDREARRPWWRVW